jgi:hypothetical protein
VAEAVVVRGRLGLGILLPCELHVADEVYFLQYSHGFAHLHCWHLVVCWLTVSLEGGGERGEEVEFTGAGVKGLMESGGEGEGEFILLPEYAQYLLYAFNAYA